jgi:hypothetical protein
VIAIFLSVLLCATTVAGVPAIASAQILPLPPALPTPTGVTPLDSSFEEPVRTLPTGWVFTPSFSLAEVFDDNVFVSTTDPQSDFITRFTPGVQLGYRSTPFTILASSSIDGEIYVENPELNGINRKRAALEAKYLPYQLLTLSLDVAYFETETPTDLVPTTGLQLGRSRATQVSVIPAAIYEFTPRDTGTASYAFFRDTIEGGLDNYTHRVKLGYARELTAVDTGFVNYRLHVFESQENPTTITNTPTVGWKRRFGPNTVLTLEGGPRFVSGGPAFVEDVVEPEAHGALEHRTRFASFVLEYHRTEAVVVGRPGKSELESMTGAVLVEPLRALQLRFQPGWYRTFKGGDPEANVYGFLLGAIYPIRTWLNARLDYQFAYQRQAGESLAHNIVTVGVDLAYPIRVSP